MKYTYTLTGYNEAKNILSMSNKGATGGVSPTASQNPKPVTSGATAGQQTPKGATATATPTQTGATTSGTPSGLMSIYNQNFANYKPVSIKLSELDKKLEQSMEGSGTVEKDDYDRIIRIINIFRKAYDKYATITIPSGRKDGRVSQSVYREYEYIGDDKNNRREWSSDKGPGDGPWAVKTTYDKWQELVMGILEDPKLRKVLANTDFVSLAEDSTGTQQSVKSSGTNLFDFIEEMLNGKGEFKKIRSKILRKYFNITDSGDSRSDSPSRSSSGSSTGTTSPTGTGGQRIQTKWKDADLNESFVNGCFYKLKYNWDSAEGIGKKGNDVKGDNSFLIFWVGKFIGDKMIMVGHRETRNYIIKEVLGNNYVLDALNLSNGGEMTLCGVKLDRDKKIKNLKDKFMYMMKNGVWNISTEEPFSLDDKCGKRKVNNIVEIKILVDSSNDTPIKNTTKTIEDFRGNSQTIGNLKNAIS